MHGPNQGILTLPVADWHGPFFRRLTDRQVNHVHRRITRGEQLPFFHSLAENTVERLDAVCRVNGPADVFRVAEQRVEVVPVRVP